MQDYAAQEEIGSSFQQFRPQTIMMQTRAVGTQFITDENYGEAIEEIRAAIDELNDFYSEMGREEMVDNSMEVHSLREWLKDVETEAEEKRPVPEREKLERKLSKAIKAENYEQAAELRDRISSLSPHTKSVSYTHLTLPTKA